TFNLPDMRGRVAVALDNMGGVTANRLASSASGGLGSVRHTLGGAGGEDAHVLTVAEMPSHSHPGGSVTINDPGHGHSITSSSGGHIGSGSFGSGTSGGTLY